MVFRIDLKIFAFLILFYFTRQIEIYWVIMVFAIIHECSHLLAGLILKMKVKNVTLMPVGLSIEFALTEKDYNKKVFKSNMIEVKRIIVAIAGPIANLIVIVIMNFINLNNNITNTIIYSNFLILIFNLLPIYPLDGGRILKSALSLLVNKRNATIYINRISNVVLFLITFLFSILIYYLKNIALLFILVYLWYIVLKENKIYRMKIRLYDMLKYF
jgi:stage IV sporulation protein FB